MTFIIDLVFQTVLELLLLRYRRSIRTVKRYSAAKA
jgi:hypothetical protein